MMTDIAQHGEFPGNSQTAVYCVRALDGSPGGGEVHDVLSAFDTMIEHLKR
jgi:hypothetical protein